MHLGAGVSELLLFSLIYMDEDYVYELPLYLIMHAFHAYVS